MTSVFTIKMAPPLLKELAIAARHTGKSRGALVREALQLLLAQRVSAAAQIAVITEALAKKKKPRLKVDWEEIRACCSAGSEKLTPEEEVRLARRRHL